MKHARLTILLLAAGLCVGCGAMPRQHNVFHRSGFSLGAALPLTINWLTRCWH